MRAFNFGHFILARKASQLDAGCPACWANLMSGVNITSILVALVGAIILLALYRLVAQRH